MREIIIIQHCQSEHHINEMSGGWTDTPLTKLGREQSNLIGLRLKGEINSDYDPKNYALYSSDLKRAWQTAEIIGKHLDLPIVANKGLREINTGVAAGKTKKWAKAHRNPRDNINFNWDYQEFSQGETWRQFFRRVCSCMEQIFDSEDKNLILVTHGGTLAYIVAWWLKCEEDMMSKCHFIASPGSISVLQESRYYLGQHALSIFNDTSHLNELKPYRD
ncbi:MAG: histidine phosphatase family protein [Promethearchaeota archaeon]